MVNIITLSMSISNEWIKLCLLDYSCSVYIFQLHSKGYGKWVIMTDLIWQVSTNTQDIDTVCFLQKSIPNMKVLAAIINLIYINYILRAANMSSTEHKLFQAAAGRCMATCIEVSNRLSMLATHFRPPSGRPQLWLPICFPSGTVSPSPMTHLQTFWQESSNSNQSCTQFRL